MPQSLVQIYVHIVYSTRNRHPFLTMWPFDRASMLTCAASARIRDRRHVDPLIAYIANQEEHHKTESFQDEFRRLCKKYGCHR